jgi:hypothetical protein
MQVPEATAKRWWAVLFRRNSEQTGKTEAQRLFWRGKKEELENLLCNQGIYLGSNMMLCLPEIKGSRETKSMIEERIRTAFGQNLRFFNAFFNLFNNYPMEVAVALSKINELFDLPDPSRCRPRKMVALFYAMITKNDFSGYAVTPEDFIRRLEAIKEVVVKGIDPFNELKFNLYLEELIHQFRSEL